ncbi:MAG: hypothetical protein F4X00_00570 [Gemmatimonadetes bacterium]|nr:hypothetical protein [Gemmatimonadota bacterium]
MLSDLVSDEVSASVLSLLLPIFVAAVLVFVASSVIHMFIGYHRNDRRAVPDENGAMDALRGLGLEPGNYAIPHAGSMEVMKSDEFQEMARRGPSAFLTVLPPNPQARMGRQLLQWFVYCLVVGLITAFVCVMALGPGEEYLTVFVLASTAAFMGYAMALAQDAIWSFQGWAATARSMFDGLIYALLTGGAFGWLWP